MKALIKAAAQSLNLNEDDLPELKHTFSCEKDPVKQKFISDLCPPERLFDDALGDVPVGVKWVSAGFPCDDASALHPSSSSEEHRLCVAQA